MQYTSIIAILAATVAAAPQFSGILSNIPVVGSIPGANAITGNGAAAPANNAAADAPVVPATDRTPGTCAAGTASSCCSTNGSSQGLLGNVLGGSCTLSNLDVPVINIVPEIGGGQCRDGNTYCCPTNSDGTLNIQAACIPLNF